jgi:maltose O-acetyltransferase
MKFSIFEINPITMIRKLQLKLLVKAGLRLGRNVYVDENVSFDSSFCWLISIGDECTISKHVIILAHDASTKRHLDFTKIGRVQVGKRTFIGAGSVILPGVTIGDNVIVGAGSVVTHDIPDNCVAAGNPARIIKSTNDYLNHQKRNLSVRPTYARKGWTGKSATAKNKRLMNEALSNGIGYIE